MRWLRGFLVMAVVLQLVVISVIVPEVEASNQRRESIAIDTNGIFVTTDSKYRSSSSGLIYKTVEWIITKETHCNPNKTSCTPLEGDGPRLTFKLNDGEDPRPGEFNVVNESFYEHSGHTRVVTTFHIPMEEAQDKLYEAFYSKSENVHGFTLYFHSIFKTVDLKSGQKYGPFTTLAGILGASNNWSAQAKQDFPKYYDIPVQVEVRKPVLLKGITTVGELLYEKHIPNTYDPNHPGQNIGYLPGDHPGPIYYDPVFTDDEGQQYKVVGSWLEDTLDKSRKRYFPITTQQYYRNFSVAFGGTTIYVEHEPMGRVPLARAFYYDTAGQLLKEPVAVQIKDGNAYHTFRHGEMLGGLPHVLTRSYKVNRNEPGTKLEELATDPDPRVGTDRPMSATGIKPEDKGYEFVGIYQRGDLGATALIRAESYVPEATTTVSGVFEFTAHSQNLDLKEYKILSIQNASLRIPSQETGTLSGKAQTVSLPIEIPLNSDVTTVSITVLVYDASGMEADAMASLTITKARLAEDTELETGHATSLKAMDRGTEAYDVLQGIPSSEELYANVIGAKQYLHEFSHEGVSGARIYDITVSKQYRPVWEEEESYSCTKTVIDKDGKEKEEDSTCHRTVEVKGSYQTFSKTFHVSRPFHFYRIARFSLYALDHAQIHNGALNGGVARLDPKGYNPPSADVEHSPDPEDHVIDAEVKSFHVDLGTSDVSRSSWSSYGFYDGFESTAEAQVGRVRVRNDRLHLTLGDGSSHVIMDDSYRFTETEEPGAIPEAPLIHEDTLYKTGLEIPPATPNGEYLSTGTLQYSLAAGIKDAAGMVNAELTPNPVTVHTPVVDYARIPDKDREFDQRVNPPVDEPGSPRRPALILAREFTVQLGETGLHRPIPGYSGPSYQEKDFGAYTKAKYVKFPFDTYRKDRALFYPKDTWIEYPVDEESMDYYLPEWVDEGDYTIQTKVLALNAEGEEEAQACERSFNERLENTCAIREVEVTVVGRMFGFRITDIGDLRFREVFDSEGAMYAAGGKDLDGKPTEYSGRASWMLPVRGGSHPVQKATVPRNGYSFHFELSTMGNLFGKAEGIQIKPTFYFVEKDGTGRVPVDLYYNASDSNKLVKVGSSEDRQLFKRSYPFAGTFKRIQEADLQTAAEFEYRTLLNEEERSRFMKGTGGVDEGLSLFMKHYMERRVDVANGYGIGVLNEKSRVLKGPSSIPSGVDPWDAKASVQQWHGEYSLPIAPYILPAGTDLGALTREFGGYLTGNERRDGKRVFLSNGYILVHFQLYTVKSSVTMDSVSEDGTVARVLKPILGYAVNEDSDDRMFGNMWRTEGQLEGLPPGIFKYGDIILFESDFSVRNDIHGSGQ